MANADQAEALGPLRSGREWQTRRFQAASPIGLAIRISSGMMLAIEVAAFNQFLRLRDNDELRRLVSSLSRTAAVCRLDRRRRTTRAIRGRAARASPGTADRCFLCGDRTPSRSAQGDYRRRRPERAPQGDASQLAPRVALWSLRPGLRGAALARWLAACRNWA